MRILTFKSLNRAAAIPVLIACLFAGSGTLQAQAIDTDAREAVLLDPATDTVLLNKNANDRMPPASMSKLMTIFMLFESIKEGRVSLEDMFQVSENAWRTGGAASGGSTMFLPPNSKVKVEDLIRGIVVQSGNDACIVVAENLAGSEEAFARRMTDRAAALGMTNSNFANSTGLPDPNHYTTAHDLAILAEHLLKDFPQFNHYYIEPDFTFNGIKQSNRNPLVYTYPGADGLKTGHTEEAGYGLTGTAKKDDRRLILVINGLPSSKARAEEAARILDWGFREFDNYRLFGKDQTVDVAPVWLGTAPTVEMKVDRDVFLTMTRKARSKMKVTVRYVAPIPAPIQAGQQIGTVTIEAEDFETVHLPLRASVDIAQLGMFGRLGAALEYLLWGGKHG